MELIDLSVTRVVPAPPEAVFDAWINAKRPGSPWFGAERSLVNPVVDGFFYFAVQHEGRRWPHYGRFIEIDRPRVVEYTWVSEATKGCESTVRVTFAPQGSETLMTLKHSGVPDDPMGRQHQEGWNWILSNLAESFGAKKNS